MTKRQKKLWASLVVMALLTPLGVILPEKFQAGEAWGEWDPDTLAKLLGYVPEGLKKYARLWQAPLPDYPLGDGGAAGLPLAAYLLSALLGLVLAAGALYLLARFLVRRDG